MIPGVWNGEKFLSLFKRVIFNLLKVLTLFWLPAVWLLEHSSWWWKSVLDEKHNVWEHQRQRRPAETSKLKSDLILENTLSGQKFVDAWIFQPCGLKEHVILKNHRWESAALRGFTVPSSCFSLDVEAAAGKSDTKLDEPFSLHEWLCAEKQWDKRFLQKLMFKIMFLQHLHFPSM